MTLSGRLQKEAARRAGAANNARQISEDLCQRIAGRDAMIADLQARIRYLQAELNALRYKPVRRLSSRPTKAVGSAVAIRGNVAPPRRQA